MIRVSKKRFFERLDKMPPTVREAAFSPDTGSIISAIGKTYHLDEQRIGTLVAATGAVFFGFIHRTDLMKEILEETRVDAKIAQSIADEMERKVFARIQDDLDKVFEPVSAEEEVEEEIAPTPSPAEENNSLPQTKFRPVATRGEISFAPPKGEGPLILHEEKGAAAEAQKGFRGFSMPLSFLRSKIATNAAPKAAARVEVPPAGNEPRIVHYNENRTPLSPFGEKEEFINLETFEKFSTPTGRSPAVSIGSTGSPQENRGKETVPPPKEMPVVIAIPPTHTGEPTPEKKPTAPQAVVPQTAEPQSVAPKPAALEGGEPKLSGNTVDLR
ncbi:MAG: hypothetical protein V1656_01280 [Candidatus Jorgensenbacteria bacterium]